MNNAADTNTGLSPSVPSPSALRLCVSIKLHAPIRSIRRHRARRGRRGNLDERGDKPANAVEACTEGVACAAVGSREGLGGVGVEDAVHLFPNGGSEHAVSYLPRRWDLPRSCKGG